MARLVPPQESVRHSIRWFAACAGIATLQFWMWTGLAQEDGETVGWPEALWSFVFVCLVAWFILPSQRPLGFDRADLGRAEIMR